MEWSAVNVRDFRKRLALSQAKFSILLGVGLSTVEFIERGRAPGPRVARKLCAARAEYENGSLDLSWVQHWHTGPRAKPDAHRLEVKRIVKPDQRVKKRKPYRAEVICTLIPPQKAARLHRKVASLQIHDVAALPGLLAHVRASIREYLEALPAQQGKSTATAQSPSQGNAVSYRTSSATPPPGAMAL